MHNVRPTATNVNAVNSTNEIARNDNVAQCTMCNQPMKGSAPPTTNDPLTHEVQEPNAPLKRTSFHGRRAVLASSEMRARPCLSAQTNMQHIGIDRLEVFVPKTHIFKNKPLRKNMFFTIKVMLT